MSVSLAYSERSKSYLLCRGELGEDVGPVLALKAFDSEEKKALSIKLLKTNYNLQFTTKTVAKFETVIGFVSFQKGTSILSFSDL